MARNENAVRKAKSAVAPAPAEPSAGYRKSTSREYFESIVIAVVLALFVRTFVVQAFKIPTGSMENNLLIGDHLLVNKFVYGPAATPLERALLPIQSIQRGDIIVFKFPEEPERDFIKRIIGLPGETLELKGRTMYVNGKPLSEPYVQFIEEGNPGAPAEDGSDGDVRRRYGPVTVPPNHYFAMGDNRDNSQDSRYWGFLPRDYIKGQAMFIYWSYEAETADFQRTGVGEQVGGFVSTVAHLFTKTRWSRLLHQIH